jgi:hypothetical protein
VNFATPAFPGSGSGFDSRQRRNRLALGVAISLAVHVLLVTAWRTGQMRPRTEQEPARAMAVWLRPPPPAVPRVEEPPPPAAAPREPREPEPKPARAQRRPRRIIAVPSRPQTEQQPEPFVVQPAPQAQPEADTPRFDRDAARKMARGLASMRDPGKADTAVGQFPDKPLETETRAARAIAGAKRRNCKDGLPGGLLGPFILLMDKKDSGCKW